MCWMCICRCMSRGRIGEIRNFGVWDGGRYEGAGGGIRHRMEHVRHREG